MEEEWYIGALSGSTLTVPTDRIRWTGLLAEHDGYERARSGAARDSEILARRYSTVESINAANGQ